MNIAAITKALVSAAGGLLSTLTTALTMFEALPGHASLIAAVVSLVGGSSAVTTFLVWLVANEPKLVADVKAAEPVVAEIGQLVGQARSLGSAYSQASAAAPATVAAATPAAVSNPVAAVTSVVTPVVTAAETVVSDVASLLRANKIQ